MLPLDIPVQCCLNLILDLWNKPWHLLDLAGPKSTDAQYCPLPFPNTKLNVCDQHKNVRTSWKNRIWRFSILYEFHKLLTKKLFFRMADSFYSFLFVYLREGWIGSS
jgi:hypothetical protein